MSPRHPPTPVFYAWLPLELLANLSYACTPGNFFNSEKVLRGPDPLVGAETPAPQQDPSLRGKSPSEPSCLKSPARSRCVGKNRVDGVKIHGPGFLCSGR